MSGKFFLLKTEPIVHRQIAVLFESRFKFPGVLPGSLIFSDKEIR